MPSGIEARRLAAREDGNAAYVARRHEIVEAAAHVFRERGPEATLRDVADALGADRASLYYYVGSKEELLREIVRDALDRDIAAAKAIKRSRASAPEKIEALIESMVVSYAENYPHVNVYVEDLGRIARQDDGWSVATIAQTKEYEALVVSIMAKGRTDGALRADLPVDLSAMALFGMINWMYRWYRPSVQATPKEIARTFAEIFLRGSCHGNPTSR